MKFHCSSLTKWLTIFFFLFYMDGAFAQKKAEGDNIIIVTNDWTSQNVLSHIFKNILGHLEIKASFKKLKTDEQWGHLSRGWAHIQVEVWQGTMEKMLNKLVKSGSILEAGTYDAVTREEWWYPYYVEEKCPDLPDWKALKKCAHLFSVDGLGKMGRYLGGPWEKPDRARVRALGLNFKIERVKEGNDLWVELEKAYRVKKPIILFNWTPNWIEFKYKGKFVNFPAYHPKCETDPSWGISKKWKYDCGNPKAGWLKKIVWKGVSKKWPCALKLLRNFNFNNRMIANVSSLVDGDKLSYEDAASLWMKENLKVWKKWIPSNCKKI